MLIEYKDDGKYYLIFVEKKFLKSKICVMRKKEDMKVADVLEHNVIASNPKDILRYWLRKLKRKLIENRRK